LSVTGVAKMPSIKGFAVNTFVFALRKIAASRLIYN
jgi:hypothetical protein